METCTKEQVDHHISSGIRKALLCILLVSGNIIKADFNSGSGGNNSDDFLSDLNNSDKIEFFISDLKGNSKLENYLTDNEILGILSKFRHDSAIEFHIKMFASPDSFYYFNDKYDRIIVDSIKAEEFDGHKEEGYRPFKSWKKKTAIDYGIDPDEIYFSKGKSFHYDFEAVQPDIDKAKEIFEEEGVDPLYAELILRIESPNGKTSVAGAGGKMQLMPALARKYGLKVNKSVDERSDIKKSAQVAANFLKDMENEIKEYLEYFKLNCKNDIYFKLLVLNSYQTGPRNMYAVFQYMKEEGLSEIDESFIRKMWNTEIAHRYKYMDNKKSSRATYGLQSRQYTQVAIAAWLKHQEDLLRESIPKSMYVDFPLKKEMAFIKSGKQKNPLGKEGNNKLERKFISKAVVNDRNRLNKAFRLRLAKHLKA